jgi:hypothetical protein
MNKTFTDCRGSKAVSSLQSQQSGPSMQLLAFSIKTLISYQMAVCTSARETASTKKSITKRAGKSSKSRVCLPITEVDENFGIHASTNKEWLYLVLQENTHKNKIGLLNIKRKGLGMNLQTGNLEFIGMCWKGEKIYMVGKNGKNNTNYSIASQTIENSPSPRCLPWEEILHLQAEKGHIVTNMALSEDLKYAGIMLYLDSVEDYMSDETIKAKSTAHHNKLYFVSLLNRSPKKTPSISMSSDSESMVLIETVGRISKVDLIMNKESKKIAYYAVMTRDHPPGLVIYRVQSPYQSIHASKVFENSELFIQQGNSLANAKRIRQECDGNLLCLSQGNRIIELRFK